MKIIHFPTVVPSVLCYCSILIILTGCLGNNSKDKVLVGTQAEDTVLYFPNTEQGYKLKRHLFTMVGHGDNAEELYQQSLERLRQDSTTLPTVIQVYEATPESEYLQRILLVQTVKDLGTDSSFAFLNAIAKSQIPPEKSPYQEYSTVNEEIIIRSTAIEGLTVLAQRGNGEAARLLYDLINLENITLKQMAIRGYLLSQDSKTRQAEAAKLKERLPQNLHWLVTDKLTDIRTALHPDMPDTFKLNEQKKSDTPHIKE
jgi:hypothetical protein